MVCARVSRHWSQGERGTSPAPKGQPWGGLPPFGSGRRQELNQAASMRELVMGMPGCAPSEFCAQGNHPCAHHTVPLFPNHTLFPPHFTICPQGSLATMASLGFPSVVLCHKGFGSVNSRNKPLSVLPAILKEGRSFHKIGTAVEYASFRITVWWDSTGQSRANQTSPSSIVAI